MQPKSNAIVKTNRDPTITCVMGVINNFLNKNFLNGYTTVQNVTLYQNTNKT